MNKKKTRFYKITGFVVMAVLTLVMVLHLALPDQAYSSAEKRALQTFPAFSLSSLEDGTLTDALDSYTQDQFPLRSFFMKLKTRLFLFLGNTKSQGVYYMRDGSLAEAFDSYDEALLQKTVDAVNSFDEAHGFSNVYFLLVPTAETTEKKKLPLFAGNGLQQQYIDELTGKLNNASLLDTGSVFDAMKENGETIYYRTDHHWTTDAAYRVFEANAETAGWTVSSYTSGVVTDSFSGSLVSKSGFTPRKLDAVTVYQDTNQDLRYMVSYYSEDTARDGFYDYEALESDNPYEVFFGGNWPKFTIRTNANTDRTLLIFKDSYANCFIPFLAESYSEITVIDPRYYTDSISTLFLTETYSDVLYLYNASTLSSDQNLQMVLSE